MNNVRKTAAFNRWSDGLKDSTVRFRLLLRIKKLESGHWGDTKLVGDGVIELREHFGPGWRIYCVREGSAGVLLLLGGSKKTQSADIRRAKILAHEARS